MTRSSPPASGPGEASDQVSVKSGRCGPASSLRPAPRNSRPGAVCRSCSQGHFWLSHACTRWPTVCTSTLDRQCQTRVSLPAPRGQDLGKAHGESRTKPRQDPSLGAMIPGLCPYVQAGSQLDRPVAVHVWAWHASTHSPWQGISIPTSLPSYGHVTPGPTSRDRLRVCVQGQTKHFRGV